MCRVYNGYISIIILNARNIVMLIIVQMIMAEKKSRASKLHLYRSRVPSKPDKVNQEPRVTIKVETMKKRRKYCKLFIGSIFITPYLPK